MDADFPAAHSMDTFWFAVDKEGQVGLFFTGENGFLPTQAPDVDGYAIAELAAEILGKTPPGIDEDGDVEDWDELLEELVNLGFFSFNYIDSFDDPDGLLWPYTLEAEPDKPLHVDQLPPAWRERCQRIQFPTVAFDDAGALQPMEFLPCITYYEENVAYLTADEKVVRPVPGREEKYREFVKEYADEMRKSRKGLRIEGVGPSPETPTQE